MSSAEKTAFPRLIVVTNDEIAGRADFLQQATAIMEACGARVMFQLRAHGLKAAELFPLAESLARTAAGSGSLIFVNGRFDVALAAGADGVHLGQASIPLAAGKRASPGLLVGASVHSAGEAAAAAADGADILVAGTIWGSATHPGDPGRGSALVMEIARQVSVPLYAIGGVTPARAVDAVQAGADGVAVISGIWNAVRPADAAVSFLEAMQVKS